MPRLERTLSSEAPLGVVSRTRTTRDRVRQWGVLEENRGYITEQYFGEKRPAKSLGEEFGVRGSVIVDFLRGKGHVTRGPAEAVRTYWADDDRKAEHNRRTHSPQGNRNRAAAVHNFHVTHPDRSEQIVESFRQRGREKTMQHMTSAFGSDPKATLARLHWEQGLSVAEIAAMTHRAVGTITRWMSLLNVEERKKTKSRGPTINEENRRLVKQAIAEGTFTVVTPLAQFVLLARYMERQSKTQQELANLMQHGERRIISQIERKALNKLRLKYAK